MELVGDAGGRFAASCCALGTRSCWHISIRGRDKGIRGKGKSGHFERMEMIGSIQEILCLLLTAQLDCKKDGRGGNQRAYVGFSHYTRRKGISSTARCTLLSRHPCHARSSSNAPSIQNAKKNASVTMLSVSCRKIHRSCKALIPSILHSHSGKCLSAATISTSLSTTIGRSQYLFSIVGEAVKN
jgi:hypothetical protein